jgi:hypothetical protein
MLVGRRELLRAKKAVDEGTTPTAGCEFEKLQQTTPSFRETEK